MKTIKTVRLLHCYNKWFAWHPITISRKIDDCHIKYTKIWWEYVERKLVHESDYTGESYTFWEYKIC